MFSGVERLSNGPGSVAYNGVAYLAPLFNAFHFHGFVMKKINMFVFCMK